MPVTAVNTDPENLTMTLVAEFEASVDRLWEVFTEPRQLERFWGPPGWPATFTAFDLQPGGRAQYRMTSPTGEASYGAWEFIRVDAPSSFEVLDSFADEAGTPSGDMPSMRMTFEFEGDREHSRLTTTTYFASSEALEQLAGMGMVEGSTMAMAQLDAVLQGLREYALGKGTRTELLDATHVRITRLIEGPRNLVWRAHNDPELLKQWMLGPDGWRMTLCEIDPTPGGRYRYAWEPEEGSDEVGFGFDGETLLIDAPRRSVTTEHMTGTDYPATTNDLSFYEEEGVTLLTLLIEYPDEQTRDMVLATGMAEGMETSYARLESVLLS